MYRGLLGIGLALLLVGCGFEPLYGPKGGKEVSAQLASIDVRPIPDRPGQLLRTHLGHLLAPYGKKKEPLYTLDITTQFEEMVLSFLKADMSSRTRVTLTVTFVCKEKSGKVILEDTFQSWADYNVVLPSDYSTVMEKERARNQTITNAAEDIALRLANFFNETTRP